MVGQEQQKTGVKNKKSFRNLVIIKSYNYATSAPKPAEAPCAVAQASTLKIWLNPSSGPASLCDLDFRHPFERGVRPAARKIFINL